MGIIGGSIQRLTMEGVSNDIGRGGDHDQQEDSQVQPDGHSGAAN